MNPDENDSTRIPVIDERIVVDKVAAVTDRVRVSTATETRDVVVEDVVRRGALGIERMAVDREVSEAPPPRHEGDLLVISVVEERLVKRLFVIEEVRIRQTTTSENVSLPTTLRTMRATVVRDDDSTTGGRLSWPR